MDRKKLRACLLDLVDLIDDAESDDMLMCPRPTKPDLPPHVPRAYNLKFEDQFNGSLDYSRWKTALPWGAGENINNEQQYYVDVAGGGGYQAVNPFSFDSAGNLVISAQPDPNVPQILKKDENGNLVLPHQPTHTSGVITTEASCCFTYGYVDVRAKLPKSCGSWPAFWLLHKNYPQTAEIDILEAPISCAGSPVLNENCVQKAYYYTDAQGARWCMDSFGVRKDDQPDSRNFGQCPVDLAPAAAAGLSASSVGGSSLGTTCLSDGSAWGDDFHTFGAEWCAGALRYYIDGCLVASICEDPPGATIYDQDMFLIINLAAGGWYPGPAPANYDDDLVVERVRIYTK